MKHERITVDWLVFPMNSKGDSVWIRHQSLLPAPLSKPNSHSGSSVVVSKVSTKYINRLDPIFYLIHQIQMVLRIFCMYKPTNLRIFQETEFVYLLLCTVNVNNNIHFCFKKFVDS